MSPQQLAKLGVPVAELVEEAWRRGAGRTLRRVTKEERTVAFLLAPATGRTDPASNSGIVRR